VESMWGERGEGHVGNGGGERRGGGDMRGGEEAEELTYVSPHMLFCPVSHPVGQGDRL